MFKASTPYLLDSWRREALELAVCPDCGGSGADCWDHGHACARCKGRGKAAREPHVVELVDLVRQQAAEADELARSRLAAEAEAGELRLEVDRLRGELCGLRGVLSRLRDQLRITTTTEAP